MRVFARVLALAALAVALVLGTTGASGSVEVQGRNNPPICC